MNWTTLAPVLKLQNLDTVVDKAGSTDSVAIVAIIWLIAIVAAAE